MLQHISSINPQSIPQAQRRLAAGGGSEYGTASGPGSAVGGASISGSLRNLLTVSSVDNESFVSAQDTIADLADFDDLNDVLGERISSVCSYTRELKKSVFLER